MSVISSAKPVFRPLLGGVGRGGVAHCSGRAGAAAGRRTGGADCGSGGDAVGGVTGAGGGVWGDVWGGGGWAFGLKAALDEAGGYGASCLIVFPVSLACLSQRYTARMQGANGGIPVFTPDDEPYLGRELLFQFDNLICACMELNSKCAPASHGRPLSSLQRALCILVPQTISLALSIRELIRQGYLLGAKVLVRPATERAVTILYLFNNPEGLRLWDEGWNYRSRPGLQRMMEYLSEQLTSGRFNSMRGITHALNSATHGDPLSARWNVIIREDGIPVFPASKNLSSPELADEICAEIIPWLAATMGMMAAGFGSDTAPTVGAGL